MTLSRKDTHHCPLYENLNWLPLSEKMRDLLILICWSGLSPHQRYQNQTRIWCPTFLCIFFFFLWIFLYKALIKELPADKEWVAETARFVTYSAVPYSWDKGICRKKMVFGGRMNRNLLRKWLFTSLEYLWRQKWKQMAVILCDALYIKLMYI